MIKRIELCNSNGNVIHVLPREKDLKLGETKLASLISEFVEDITHRGWISEKDKTETKELISLAFAKDYEAECSFLLWNYKVKISISS